MRWATLGRGRFYFFLLILPAVLYVVAWRIAPALYTILLSFTQYNIVYDAGPTWNHLQNYGRLLHDRSLLESLRISVVFTVAATAVELLVGLGVGVFFDSDPPARNLLLGVFLLPMIMAPVVVGTIWGILFDPTIGPIPYLIQVLHGPRVEWLGSSLLALGGLVVADAWEWSPLLALLLFSAMQTIPREQYEAARVDGSSGWQLFWRVILPQVRGMVIVAAGLRFMDALLELDKVIVMTGGGPGASTGFVSYYVYRQAFQAYELGYASTVITGLLALLAVVYGFYLRNSSRMLRSANV